MLKIVGKAIWSEWVQSELQRAKRKGRPIFPVLLEGDEPWLSVESTQYYDVRDGQLPMMSFMRTLNVQGLQSKLPGTFLKSSGLLEKQNL